MATLIEQASSSADLTIIRQLFSEYAAELNVDLCFQSFDEELRSLPGRYAQPRGRLFVGRLDGAVAGCIALRSIGDDEGEVKRLYVRPAHRRRGLGRELVGAIISAAREESYKVLFLDTLESMKPAIALYQSFGFQPTIPYYTNPLAEVVYLRLTL